MKVKKGREWRGSCRTYLGVDFLYLFELAGPNGVAKLETCLLGGPHALIYTTVKGCRFYKHRSATKKNEHQNSKAHAASLTPNSV